MHAGVTFDEIPFHPGVATGFIAFRRVRMMRGISAGMPGSTGLMSENSEAPPQTVKMREQ